MAAAAGAAGGASTGQMMGQLGASKKTGGKHDMFAEQGVGKEMPMIDIQGELGSLLDMQSKGIGQSKPFQPNQQPQMNSYLHSLLGR